MGMSVARRLAKVILNGFDAFFGDFQNVTLGAQMRFENADWQGVHSEMSRRLAMYRLKRNEVALLAESVAGVSLKSHELWHETRLEYARLVRFHRNYEITQTFYNSVYCHVFQHERIIDNYAFVLDQEKPARNFDDSILLAYKISGDIEGFVRTVLLGTEFSLPFEDLERDVSRVAEVVREKLVARFPENTEFLVEVLESIFYRNKAGYVVGRVAVGDQFLPFVLPFLNNEKGGIYVDTVVYAPDDLSILFSFTRAYFMVDASIPSQYVAFLKSIMPHKETFELYSALGFVKHGKSEFYRRAVEQTLASDDQYITAPGIKGMVMLVFTRPSFDYVYKVIKERFTPPKDMSREEVKEKYRLVKSSDKAGRMADTQEFTNLAFDRRRFSDELMQELYKEVPSLIEERGNALILKHVYVERKMVPLNLYLKDATEEQLYNVMDEYGNAIKQLASANIFPGDMLLKNFGVTRHGRVVFYDYDEICPLVDCNFRELPKPQNEEQEMASQPWYDVAPNDVFPEEFRLFFSGNRAAKKVFDKLHSELYSASFWIDLQQQILNGAVGDVFPYRRKYRFKRPD